MVLSCTLSLLRQIYTAHNRGERSVSLPSAEIVRSAASWTSWAFKFESFNALASSFLSFFALGTEIALSLSFEEFCKPGDTPCLFDGLWLPFTAGLVILTLGRFSCNLSSIGAPFCFIRFDMLCFELSCANGRSWAFLFPAMPAWPFSVFCLTALNCLLVLYNISLVAAFTPFCAPANIQDWREAENYNVEDMSTIVCYSLCDDNSAEQTGTGSSGDPIVFSSEEYLSSQAGMQHPLKMSQLLKSSWMRYKRAQVRMKDLHKCQFPIFWGVDLKS